MTTANLSEKELPAPPVEKELPSPQFHDTDSKPLIILLMVVLILALVGMGGLFLWTKQASLSNDVQPVKNFTFSILTPTPSSTSNTESTNSANWKTYNDKYYNFSFSYSPYFQYVVTNPSPYGGAYLAPKEGVGPYKGSAGALSGNDVWLVATTTSASDVKSLDDYFKQQADSKLFKNNYLNSTKQQITIAGIPGYKVIQNNPSSFSTTAKVFFYEGLFLKDNRIFHLYFYAFNKDVFAKSETVFDQILSTFKFTSQ